MTTRHFIQKKIDGQWKLVEPAAVPPAKPVGPYFMKDIEPYRSTATSDMPEITSRSKEREYMKRNDFITFEEMQSMPKIPKEQRIDPKIKEELIARFNP
jgi:hypothetical protein